MDLIKKNQEGILARVRIAEVILIQESTTPGHLVVYTVMPLELALKFGYKIEKDFVDYHVANIN